MQTKNKKRKCAVRGCKNIVRAGNTLIRHCSPSCGWKLHRAKQAKKEKKQRAMDKVQRDALRPYSYWVKRTQKMFNKYVRYRDRKEPCISCQRHHEGQYHCGHFLTTGARPELRFHPANGHRQCSACNNHLSGNIVLYRENLINKAGLEMVEWLEGYSNKVNWSIDELEEIRVYYRDELKRLKK